MINLIEQTGLNLDLKDDFKKYARKKIGNLDRYIPRHARKTARAEVKVKEVNLANGNKYECEVILNIPHEQIVVKEATLNMFAAIDIIEERLKNMLKKYKTTIDDHRGRHGFLSRFKRSLPSDTEVAQLE